jgi:type IV pilus assembly protein PilM
MPLPFFKSRVKKREDVIAIDLGGRHTKAVHVQNKGGRLTLVNFTVQDSPSEDSATPSVDVLSEHLKSVTRALGEGTKTVVVSLGVADSVVRRTEMPPMPMDDMRQLLKFNTKTYLQQDLPDHVFDCSVVLARMSDGTKPAEAPKPVAGQKQQLIVGAGKRQVVEDVASAIREAGLVAAQVVPGLVGPVNALELSEPEIFANEAVALVDLGFRNTSITILQRGELIMHRVVHLGGDRLTQGLADTMGISYAEAEGIKVGMPTEVQAALEPLVGGLGRELRAFLDFFEHQQDVPVSQVFVSGGSARGELLVQALQLELMVPCRTWNPAKSFDMTLSPELAAEFAVASPQLAAAVGAAISAL